MQQNLEILTELEILGIQLPAPTDVFVVPEKYLENVTENIIEEISIMITTDTFTKTNVYTPPADYFENFEVQIASNEVPIKKYNQSLFTKTMHWSIAASVAFLLFFGYHNVSVNYKGADSISSNSQIFLNINDADIIEYETENIVENEKQFDMEIAKQLLTTDDAEITQYVNEQALELETNS